MKTFLALLLVFPICAQAVTVYSADGTPLMQQTVTGNHVVDRAMDGTPLSKLTREGNVITRRSMDGTLLETIRK